MHRRNDPVLIAGGAGFIGSHVATALASSHTVHVIDNLTRGRSQDLPFDSILHVGDVSDENYLKRVLSAANFRVIVHCAALKPPSFDKAELESTNIEGTRALVRCAKLYEIPRVILISSCAVYGETPRPVTERAALRPLNAYGYTKAVSERLVIESGLPHVILRLSNVYGPGQGDDDEGGGVVGIFLRRISVGKPVVIFGDGNQMRDFIFVDDVVRAIALSIGYPTSTTWNVASGSSISINHLVRLVSRTLQTSAAVEHRLPQKDHIHNSLVSNEELTSTGLWQPRFPIEKGLRKLVECG